MNKIYKKIWNQSRGCFVAVSETSPSVSKSAGKSAIVVGFSLLIAGSANALVTINGDGTFSDLPMKMSTAPTAFNYVTEDTHITGNFRYSNSDLSSALYIGCTSGSEPWGSITVTVDRDFTVESTRHWIIAHNHDRGQDVFGSTVVHGNAYNYGHITVGTRNVSHDASIKANLTVDGTLYNYGLINNNSDNIHGAARLVSPISIGTLRNEGTFQQLGGSVNTRLTHLQQAVGVFRQTSNHSVYVTDSVVLSGGTLETTDPLTIGARNGLFSVGVLLNLAGGSLNQTDLLSQKAGQVSVTGGSYKFTTLSKENGTLTNFGTLEVTNFNQSGGSAKNSGTLTIANSNLGGTLENVARLTLTGNVNTRGNLTSTGTLTNNGNWTEANRYTITGNLHNTGSINFQNGFHIQNGFMTSSGTIQTNDAFNIFDSLGTTGQQDLHYIALGSTVPQDVKTSLTDFFQKYLPGTLAKSLVGHASFTAGKVIVSGVTLTQTQHDDLVKVFKDKFLSFFSQNETAQLCRS